jgi:TRAP transporter TAXI family solute receptor
VKKDAPIRAIADLKGKRVTYGYTAQVTLKRVVDSILANGGIDASDIKTALVPNVIRGADDFAEGKADAGFFAIGAGKVSEVDKSVGGIRFLPLSDEPNALERMRKLFQYAYVAEVKPSPAYAGIASPTKLMAYDYLVLAGTHVKEDIVYRVAKTLYEQKAKLVDSLRAFEAFDVQKMYKPMPAPFHAGALKFYKERGLVK